MKIEDIQQFQLICEADNKQPKEDLLLSLAPIFLMRSSDGAEIVVDEGIQIRNGRWIPEEVEFVEWLMTVYFCVREGRRCRRVRCGAEAAPAQGDDRRRSNGVFG